MTTEVYHPCMFKREVGKITSKHNAEITKLKEDYEAKNKKLEEDYEAEYNGIIIDRITEYIISNMENSLKIYNIPYISMPNYGFSFCGDDWFADCVKLKHLISALAKDSKLSLFLEKFELEHPMVTISISYKIGDVLNTKQLDEGCDEKAMDYVLAGCCLKSKEHKPAFTFWTVENCYPYSYC